MNNMPIQEKEMLTDLLDQEKQLLNLYNAGITECSCPHMRQVLTQNLNESYQDQYSVFDQMRAKGYYQGKTAPQNDVQQAKQKFSQMQSQL